MKKISIPIPGNAYDVLIGSGIFSNILEQVAERTLTKNLFLIVDRKVYKIFRKEIESVFSKHIGKIGLITLLANESRKNSISLEKIYHALMKNKLGRDSFVLSIGGGIIGDLSGFAAATYIRGVQYAQVPTTLLSAVDSSIGGKTGLNFAGTKNIIGSFHQPRFVLIDTDFLKTLPDKEITCGLGEIVKYSLLSDQKYFFYLTKNVDEAYSKNEEVLTKLISRSVIFKGSVVTADEKEDGLRKMLNLGHTFAHAIEVTQNNKIKHGEAVIVGLACSLYLSQILGFINGNDFDEYILLLRKFAGKFNIVKYDRVKIFDIMKYDKKVRDGKIKFVLVKKIGNILIDVEAKKKDVYYAIDNGIGEFI